MRSASRGSPVAMMVYPSAELARTGDRAKSPWFQLLNGTWKFHGSLRPADRPLEFYRPDFNDSTWPVGTARFGWGLDGEVTTLTEGRVTHYFRRWFSSGVNGLSFCLGQKAAKSS